jgi:hypothetical protein
MVCDGALVVPITVHTGVVGVIERVEDAIFDQLTDAVLPEFIVDAFVSYPRSAARLRRLPAFRRTTCVPIFASWFIEVVEWMPVMCSVSTSTKAVIFSARTC